MMGYRDVFEEILSAIRIVDAKRVVLDSFTALSMSFKDRNVALELQFMYFLGKF